MKNQGEVRSGEWREEELWRGDVVWRGDVGSNATYRYRPKIPTPSELAYRLTNEVVTPKNLATAAPEYPILFTASWQNTFLALTTARLRSPPRTF